jgi:hypothetical protein
VKIACAKELNISVIDCDIFDLLVNFRNVQINNPIELANRLKKFEPTKEEYK